MTKILKRDAIVLNLFEKETGFLFGEDVFVGMENTLVKTVLTRNEAPLTDVERALYEVEFHFNLLGLELKNNDSLATDIVAKKLLEAYNPVREEVDYDILIEGVSVSEEQSDEIPSSKDEVIVGENQLTISEILENFQLKKQNPTFSENYIEEKTDLNQESNRNNQDQHKLTGEEKRKLTHEGVMDALGQKFSKLADISEVVKDYVDVSDTTVRNVLIELTEDGVVNQVGRGVYELVNGADTKSEESQVNDQHSSLESSKTEKIEVKTQSQETKVLPKTQPTQQHIQPVQQPVMQYGQGLLNGPNDEEVVPASIFHSLYRDNDKVEEYLKERGVRPALIKWVINYRTKNANRLVNAPQEVIDIIEPEMEYIGKVSVIEKCITALMRRSPLNLKGDAATGKTTLVRFLSAITNLPLFTVNGSLEANKGTLVGEPAIDVYRRFIVKQGQLTKAMDRDGFGGILYIDEINMMRPDNLALINPATDGRRQFYNDVEKRTVFAHKDFHFISAMNVGYAGVKKMNEATMDRPGAIQLTYPGKNEMKTIITNYADKINAKGKEEGLPELGLVDIIKLTDLYLELVSASNIPTLARSARNITLMAEYVPILGYTDALQMVLDKFDEPRDAAAVVGVLAKNDILNKLGVDPDELIIGK